jgi:hypothetical protein
MNNSFSGFIDKREIEKKVDQLLTTLEDTTSIKITNSENNNQTKVELTSPYSYLKDTYDIVKTTTSLVQEEINRIEAKYSDDEVFSAFFAAAKVQFATPYDSNYKTTQVPPENIQTIIERDIYRRQTNPEIILVKDYYRSRGQLAVIQNAYENVYMPLLERDNLNSDTVKRLLIGVILKDQQLANNIRENISKIKGLVEDIISEDAVKGILNLASTYPNEINKYLSFSNFSFVTEVDRLYDEFKMLDTALDTSLGTVSGNNYGKLSRSWGFDYLYRTKDILLNLTEDVERDNSTFTADPILLKYRQTIEKSLFDALKNVESEFLVQDQQFFQAYEVRQKLYGNLVDSTLNKIFLGLNKSIKNYEKQIKKEGISAKEFLEETTKAKNYPQTPPINATGKAQQAASIMKKWLKGKV